MEQLELTQESYLVAREKLRSVFFSVLIGMVIGGSIGYLIAVGMPGNPYNYMTIVVFALLFSGMPYTWRAFGYRALNWKGFLIKFIVTIFLGWIVTPFLLLVNFLQMKIYEQRTVRQVVREGECGSDKYPFTMVCAVACAVCGILFWVTEWLCLKCDLKIGGINSNTLVVVILEISIVLTSILWVLYRSSMIVAVTDMLMDMVVMWYIRNIWVLVVGAISGKISILKYLAFGWEIILLLDAIIFIGCGLFQKGRKADEDE